jgi:hypothetical protein
MFETCRGPWFSINWMKSASRWFPYTDILWCTVSKTLSIPVNILLIVSNLCRDGISVDVRSKAWICGRLITVTVDSNPADGMDIRLLCLLCVVYLAVSAMCLSLVMIIPTGRVCNPETSKSGDLRPILGVTQQKKLCTNVCNKVTGSGFMIICKKRGSYVFTSWYLSDFVLYMFHSATVVLLQC